MKQSTNEPDDIRGTALFILAGSAWPSLFSAHCSEKDGTPMIIQEPPLAFAEWADIDNAISLYAHPVQGVMMGDWRDNEPTVVLEADKSSVEQVIDARR